MSKLRLTCLLLFCLSISSLNIYCQSREVVLFFDVNSPYADKAIITPDTLKATFSIYYEEFVDESRRKVAQADYDKKLAKQNTKTLKSPGPIKAPVFSKWYFCTEQAVTLSGDNLPQYITMEEFASGQAIQINSIKILVKVDEDKYFLWNGLHSPGK